MELITNMGLNQTVQRQRNSHSLRCVSCETPEGLFPLSNPLLGVLRLIQVQGRCRGLETELLTRRTPQPHRLLTITLIFNLLQVAGRR